MSSQELLKDKYAPLERIGNGAFGEIYKGINTNIRFGDFIYLFNTYLFNFFSPLARDIKTNELVAIKYVLSLISFLSIYLVFSLLHTQKCL